jgi:SAM-dependent methyltransferase
MVADERGPGFHAVDDHPEVTMLLTAMDETARWEATRQLRSWERERLALRPGQRLLDVGCGLGDAALALSLDLGAHGEVVGVDGSEVMLAEARVRAARATCRTRFVLGDAGALSEADDSFDAVRSERMLQWVPDPGRAVAEMARVVRPGGLVCLIDSDWSTFDLDVGDPDISRRVRDTYGVDRGRPTTVGGRLAGLAEAVGLAPWPSRALRRSGRAGTRTRRPAPTAGPRCPSTPTTSSPPGTSRRRARVVHRHHQ